MENADETTNATDHVNKDIDYRIDKENTMIDQGKKYLFTKVLKRMMHLQCKIIQ
jgi:hypothetical protein